MNLFNLPGMPDATSAQATLQASAETIRPAAPPDESATPDPQLRRRTLEAAVKFEGLFVSEMLKQMRRGSATLAGADALFKPPEDNPLLAMADTLVADAMAGQRAFGIADAILRQLLPGEAGRAQMPDMRPAVPFKSTAAPVALPLQQPRLRADGSDPLPAGSPQRP